MDLVVDQVVELHDVDDPHRHFGVEHLAGPTVVEAGLPGARPTRQLQEVLDLVLPGAVEDRRGHVYALPNAPADRPHLVLAQVVHEAGLAVREHALELRPELGCAVVLLEMAVDALPERPRGPAQMRLQDLPDVHARRHPERIEHDVDRRPVVEIRHVLDRHDPRDHALVAVASGHLVARLKLALHGDEDLDHLHHPWRQLVAALELLDLALEAELQAFLAFGELRLERLDVGHGGFVLDRDLGEPARRVLGEHRLGDA